MKIIDMHCDTISILLDRELKGNTISLRENDCSIDLIKMKKGNYLLQNFACFVHRKLSENPEL